MLPSHCPCAIQLIIVSFIDQCCCKCYYLQQFENHRKLYLQLKDQVTGKDHDDSVVEEFVSTALDPIDGAENVAKNIFRDLTGEILKFIKAWESY